MLFRRIVFYAVLVGLLSGLLLTAVQFWQVIPIIQSAERFEGEPVSATATVNGHSGHDHSGHEHSADAWAPADGMERTGFTLMSNVLSAIGLALVLLAAIVASLKSNIATRLDWRYGLLWGAAGYAVFYLAPSLGVPPEIPGAIAAPLEARQLWWLSAVLCTATGLAAIAFGKSPWRWVGFGLLVVPFLFGAPQPPTGVLTNQSPAVTAELAELARQFIGATAIANAAFWLALGLTSVWSARRIVSPLNKSIFYS